MPCQTARACIFVVALMMKKAKPEAERHYPLSTRYAPSHDNHEAGAETSGRILRRQSWTMRSKEAHIIDIT